MGVYHQAWSHVGDPIQVLEVPTILHVLISNEPISACFGHNMPVTSVCLDGIGERYVAHRAVTDL